MVIQALSYQKNNVPPHIKRCGLQGHLFLGCSKIKSSKIKPPSKECGFNFGHNKKREIPEEIKKEISVLYELGLEDYEIDYIISLKTKEEASLKWKE